MCGICGVIKSKSEVTDQDTDALEKMKSALRDRGPDDHGTFVYGRVALGTRRLSIVDLAGGKQPISDGNPPSAITYNGELFNYKGIRRDLARKGHIFKTFSDTEVVLRAYMEYGADCLNHFNGEFAFAIYNGPQDTLFLARDRTGIKPLFYAVCSHGDFIFASELKAILQYGCIPAQVDADTVGDFFLGNVTFAAGNAALDKSFFSGVQSVQPGHYVTHKLGKTKTTQYWDIPISDTAIKPFDYVPELRQVVTDAITIRLADEVKMGTALSGGLDSSIVAAITVKNYLPQLTSSSVKYQAGAGSNEDYEFASLLAKQYGINLITPNLSAEEMISLIDPMIRAMDEPHDSIRQLGMYANYRELHRAGCKVALSGEGADEFNLGYYHRFPGLKLDQEVCATAEKFKAMWRRRVPYIRQYFTDQFLAKFDFEIIIEKNVSQYYERCQSDNPIRRMQYFYAKKFLKFLEDANDRCSMANSVEGRFPYLDVNVIETALRIPLNEQVSDDSEKLVLRKAFKDVLPSSIAERKKAPFPASDEMRLHKLLAFEFEQNIASASLIAWQVLNKGFIEKLAKKYNQKLQELEQVHGPGKGAEQLNAWLPIHEEVSLRTSHIFALLTFLRWLHLNQPIL